MCAAEIPLPQSEQDGIHSARLSDVPNLAAAAGLSYVLLWIAVKLFFA